MMGLGQYRSLHVAEVERAETQEHLFQLPQPEWALWRWVCLRGAGFPADGVLQLSAPAAASSADLLLSIEARLQHERSATIALFDAELARLKKEDRWEAAKSYRLWLIYAMRLMRYSKSPELSAPELAQAEEAAAAEMKKALDQVLGTEAKLVAAREEYEKQFTSALSDVLQAIRTVAACERFREAVAWQNRDVLNAGIESLLRHNSPNGSRDSKQRLNEEVIASYWQRYCVKNDTIGFFGPVGWARLVDEAGAFEARPGPSLLAARTVYFEQWGIDALTAVINKNLPAAAWASPRRLPSVRLEGDWLHVSFRRPMRLTRKQASVLRACDGTRTAAQLAAQVRRASVEWQSDAEVYTILKGLKGQGLIEWQFEVPLSAYPEQRLRELLERVTDDEVRGDALSLLEELERCRERVAAAAGNSQELDAALRELDERFTKLTGVGATRWAGRMYAGRTLVYEDCRRDIEVEIGSEFVERMSGPLVLLLQSARWFTHEVGLRFRRAFGEIYEELASKSGSRTIDAATFRMEVQGKLFSNGIGVLDEVEDEFRQRWEAVLAVSPEQRRLAYRYEDLRAAVETAFDAPRAGWTAALHHSPDLMIAAESVEAIRRGEYELVLGELHQASITLNGAVFYEQHPSSRELLRAKERDLPEPQAVPVIPNSWQPTHTLKSLNSAKDYYIEFTPESFVANRERALLVADFVVEEQDGELVARTRDGRVSFDILEMFGRTIAEYASERFHIFGKMNHTPRVSIDQLTVARETWRCAVGGLEFANLKDEAERFLETRRWARALGMPRHVFVKVPVETKPCYVDFDSPVYVNLLAKLIRRTVNKGSEEMQAVISEMLPAVNESWLPDAEGRRYTCELRMVALDQASHKKSMRHGPQQSFSPAKTQRR